MIVRFLCLYEFFNYYTKTNIVLKLFFPAVEYNIRAQIENKRYNSFTESKIR